MKKVIRVAIGIIIMASLIVGYYFYLSRKGPDNRSVQKTTEVTEYDKLVNTDLSTNYPKTPRAVVKMYSRIITEYYAKSHSDEEIEKLADQARFLFDEQLLEFNPRSTFMGNVKADIESYAQRKARIIQFNVENSSYIEYKTVQNYECAYVEAYYFSKEGNNFIRTYQDYCLRKDKDGNWKILTWQLVGGDPDHFE